MSIPTVPISEFKANPAKYISSGAVVTNHGKPRARFVPIPPDEAGQLSRPSRADTLPAAKSALRALYAAQDDDEAAEEAREVSDWRDADTLGAPS